MKRQVYISGSLSSLPTEQVEVFKKLYEELGKLVEQLGCDAYVPHLHSDPDKHAHISPKDVYAVDAKQVQESDLIICEMTIPSHGVGGEIEVAAQAGVAVLLISLEGVHVSRFSRGNPKVLEHITYNDSQDALNRVRSWLNTWLAS